MMKLDVLQVLKDLEEKDLEMEENKPATMEQIISRALVAAYKGEEELSLDKKMERWQLHQKLRANEGLPVEISETEATIIETMVNKLYGGVLIPARVREALVKARALALEVAKPKANGEVRVDQ